ncbi:hypothetical protein SAMN05421805_104170 [Saccharopolyspora antimicrobica]|uniref:Uncharacterized protein n=1 Tax=Saccharopolyspora antimicrobica TaxID=455193 RepID=A0A1I4YKM8_9PSEU|nr:hypothetical protein [Saccharopolyspora antimicrobica]RKT82699.1 hypothetical protein ATL45_0954 [Saccharopolyspora antimicrobica]SFN38109.1 hypothetical protein SAMN05421805_104170 [Saccharopolyspora antimicrobica]
MNERAERVIAVIYGAVVVTIMTAALLLHLGPQLACALLSVVAADQARVIAAMAGWSLAVGMGTGGLLLLRRFGGAR